MNPSLNFFESLRNKFRVWGEVFWLGVPSDFISEDPEQECVLNVSRSFNVLEFLEAADENFDTILQLLVDFLLFVQNEKSTLHLDNSLLTIFIHFFPVKI